MTAGKSSALEQPVYRIEASMQLTKQQRDLLRRAGLLFLLGMITGIWAGIVLSDGRAVGLQFNWALKHERLVLGAHLNGLIGCFWLLGVAGTLPYLRLNERGRLRLVRLVTLATYANWSVTLLASFFDARGLAFVGEVRNDIIAALLMIFVVLPTLAAAGLWAWGLWAEPAA